MFGGRMSRDDWKARFDRPEQKESFNNLAEWTSADLLRAAHRNISAHIVGREDDQAPLLVAAQREIRSVIRRLETP